MNFVVHHQCFKNENATEFVIKSFREYHPDIPYVLWSDNGSDYSKLCEEYNINFILSDTNVGSNYTKDKLYEFFNRVRKTCELYPDKPYVLWMEDDVLVKGKIKIPENCDFCGWPDVGNKFQQLLGNYNFKNLCKKYNVTPNFDYWTLAGGGIMSSDVFTNKFNIIEKFIEEEYENICPDFKNFLFYDVLLMLMHLICDKKYTINPQVTEVHRNSDWNNPKYTLVHGFKEYY